MDHLPHELSFKDTDFFSITHIKAMTAVKASPKLQCLIEKLIVAILSISDIGVQSCVV